MSTRPSQIQNKGVECTVSIDDSEDGVVLNGKGTYGVLRSAYLFGPWEVNKKWNVQWRELEEGIDERTVHLYINGKNVETPPNCAIAGTFGDSKGGVLTLRISFRNKNYQPSALPINPAELELKVEKAETPEVLNGNVEKQNPPVVSVNPAQEVVEPEVTTKVEEAPVKAQEALVETQVADEKNDDKMQVDAPTEPPIKEEDPTKENASETINGDQALKASKEVKVVADAVLEPKNDDQVEAVIAPEAQPELIDTFIRTEDSGMNDEVIFFFTFVSTLAYDKFPPLDNFAIPKEEIPVEEPKKAVNKRKKADTGKKESAKKPAIEKKATKEDAKPTAEGTRRSSRRRTMDAVPAESVDF